MHITGAHLGEPIRHPAEVFGDTWSAAWADDGAVYATADDTRGFGDVCSSNLALNRIDGLPPDIVGVTVNPMTAYGGMCELGPDQAHWKACGLTCIDGTLCLSVSRHVYMTAPCWVQWTWDSSIVRSDDHGRTWSPTPEFGASMFPGRNFSAPVFVEYGQDGAAGPHGSDQYVYALSAVGCWNNGSEMTLGRVRRDRIGRLDPGDWGFVQGFGESGVPDVRGNPAALEAPRWGPRHDTACPVFRAAGRASMTGARYVVPLGLYIMPQWHFRRLDDRPNPARWQSCQWDFYQAPAPWGPWTVFHSQTFEPQGFYNPTIPGKFISADGKRLWLLTCGDFATHAYYALHLIPLDLEVEGEPGPYP